MTPMLGTRTHGGASCCLRIPAFAPRSMRANVRELFRLHTREQNRSQGHAGALLGQVCAEADQKNVALVLRPDTESLVPWYEKHGFDLIQEEPVLLMTRPPKADRG
jgi:N-acetylglutamate synthase-like GNAT family acetyltransferase